MIQPNPYIRRPDEWNSFLCLGQQTSYLINGEETHGALAMMEQMFRKGFEPPTHVHRREEETFYIVEGDLTVTVGNTVVQASSGALVVLPRGIQHSYSVNSESAKVLIMVRPAGFEMFFKELSSPLPAELPPVPLGPPNEEEIRKLVSLAAKYGIEFPGLGE